MRGPQKAAPSFLGGRRSKEALRDLPTRRGEQSELCDNERAASDAANIEGGKG